MYGTAPEAFYCFVETTPGVFGYLSFGELEKPYSWTGGAYTAASYPRTHNVQAGSGRLGPLEQVYEGTGCGGLVRADYDDFNGWLGRYYQPTATGTNFSTGNGFLSSLHSDVTAHKINEAPDESSQLLRVPGYGRGDFNAGTTQAYAGLFERAYNTANNVAILLPVFVYGRRLDLGPVYSILGQLPHAMAVNMRHLTNDTVYTYGLNDYRVLATHSASATSGAFTPRLGLAFLV
jgi:hypothetical protein